MGKGKGFLFNLINQFKSPLLPGEGRGRGAESLPWGEGSTPPPAFRLVEAEPWALRSCEGLGLLSCPGPQIVHIPQMFEGKSKGNEERQAVRGVRRREKRGTHRGPVTPKILFFLFFFFNEA